MGAASINSTSKFELLKGFDLLHQQACSPFEVDSNSDQVVVRSYFKLVARVNGYSSLSWAKDLAETN